MRVLVAMSGGVDSSVAAGVLAEAGHEVEGATLKLWGGASDSGCCSVRDVDDARRVAQVLDIPHHVFSYTEEFERDVVAPYVRAHADGRTPNPCIECNRRVKFDLLFRRAARLGFDAVATGHHALVRWHDGVATLARGVDASKDQSYVLAFTDAAAIARLLLPIGEMTKDAVRDHAARWGLRTWDKPDSQDVCFIERSRGRGEFLASRIPLHAASIVDRADGAVLGTMPAAELVTVGQRRHVPRGPDGQRRFVARVDVARGRVEVDTLERVLVTTVPLVAGSLFWRGAPPAAGRVLVQRSAHGPVDAATVTGDVMTFDGPVRPVAPGQTMALYSPARPEEVLGAVLAATP